MPTTPWNIQPNCEISISLKVPFGADPSTAVTLTTTAQQLRPLQNVTTNTSVLGQSGINGYWQQRFVITAEDMATLLVSGFALDALLWSQEDSWASWITITAQPVGGGRARLIEYFVITDVSPHLYLQPDPPTNLVDAFFITAQLGNPFHAA